MQSNVSRVPCTGLFEICVNNPSRSSSSFLLRKEKRRVERRGAAPGKGKWGGNLQYTLPFPTDTLKSITLLFVPAASSFSGGEIMLIKAEIWHRCLPAPLQQPQEMIAEPFRGVSEWPLLYFNSSLSTWIQPCRGGWKSKMGSDSPSRLMPSGPVETLV